ncbi:RNA polymerase sigma factor SigJ [Mumia sp. DW29H23]|uniref:RNA polymerase sigma factor SigJ n=1 Tax=Mumia sp. DW29H23 TaxID=3421241 RepID=UPI003D690441
MTAPHRGSDHQDWLEHAFEQQRPQLRAVAYRMLGSSADAEDAVQDTWIRVSRADTASVENIGPWLRTVLSRVCLNQLRSRRQRREQPLTHIPDPVVTPDPGVDPEASAVVADGVGMALLVVLDSLSPAERLAFVLHDMFGVAFEEIGSLLDRSPAAARQLASRARRRVRGQAPTPDPDLARQRQVVDAFLAAARLGDFDALVSVLDPDVILRSDGGTARPQLTMTLRGAAQVASQARNAEVLAPFTHRVLVNGAVGLLVAPKQKAQVVMAFTIVEQKIVAIDVLADPVRLDSLDVSAVLG